MGKEEAANHADKILEDYNKNHSISRYYGSLDDSVAEIVEELKGMVRVMGNAKETGNMSDVPPEFHAFLYVNVERVIYKDKECLFLQNADNLIDLYLNEMVSQSERVKVGFKRSKIRLLIDESNRTEKAKNNPVRTIRIGETKSRQAKGIIIFSQG